MQILAVFGLVALSCVPSLSQQGVEISAAGIAGINSTAAGAEVLIYAVELQDNAADGRTVRIGVAPLAGSGIQLTISDLTAETAVTAADFTGLNLYLSGDAVIDGGDTFLRTETPVVIGGVTLVDFAGVANANRTIPDVGTTFFLISADLAPGAVGGHAFRLGVAGLHIEMRDSGGGAPTVYPIGSAIAANDANQILISAAAGGGSSSGGGGGGGSTKDPMPVPFRSIGLLGVLVCGYALWAILRRG
jgi:hypothetical protein